MNCTELFRYAQEAMKNSYAPYSHFNVGAALLCSDGKIFTGSNVENASYSVTCCAERSALFSAVAAAERDFEAIMITGGLNGKITDYTLPCGVCRQALSEFCSGDFKVFTAKSENDIREYLLSELLPESFGKSSLGGNTK